MDCMTKKVIYFVTLVLLTLGLIAPTSASAAILSPTMDAVQAAPIVSGPLVTKQSQKVHTKKPDPVVVATPPASVPEAPAKQPVIAAAKTENDWDAVARCESGGNWHISTGNGFYGGLQFTISTWTDYGGTGLPSNASRETQILVAERVLASQGVGAWPVCGKYLYHAR